MPVASAAWTRRCARGTRPRCVPRWWDPRAPLGCLRVQVVCVPEPGEDADPDPAADLAPDPVASSADAAGLALLLVLRDDRWSVEGIYD